MKATTSTEHAGTRIVGGDLETDHFDPQAPMVRNRRAPRAESEIVKLRKGW